MKTDYRMKLRTTKKSFKMTIDKKKSSDKIKNTTNNITATVMFGMPSKDCSYHGICRIEPEKYFKSDGVKCIGLANISLNEKNQLFFCFKKNQMNKDTIRRYFGSGHFIIIESYKVPEFVCKAFGRSTIVIRQGIFPLTEKEETYQVALDIRWE